MNLCARLRCCAALSLILVSLVWSAACGNDSPTAPSGTVEITDLVIGAGVEAKSTSAAAVIYTLWLYDASKPDGKGTQIETNVGGQPYTFRLGAKQVIAGWEQGIPGMKVGGKRRLVVPPSLAYGAAGSGAIPPNATLVFDIDLVGAA